MGNYAIKVEGLGKRYRIGERQRYKALRDVLTDAVYAPVRAAGRLLHRGNHKPRTDSHIWALKDVSFEVQHGEVLGIIGRNGAGKSTLLKILSRITEPTEGEVRLRGRVGSLLEVGTGFHPELTGRENVYLNGAILGMHRHEIERKFDEIVAFAEIERFLDTPVKHYSSGMYVRLAFAVAAHLEPEILLVDEVLAVGDAAFQKKCLGKMGEVADEGRTVLFVSHNMTSVESLTKRTIVVRNGRIYEDSDTDRAIKTYLSMFGQQQSTLGKFICAVFIRSDSGDPDGVIRTGDPVIIDVIVDPKGASIPDAQVGIGINDMLGIRLFTVGTYYSSVDSLAIDKKTRVRCRIDNQFLTPGRYPLKVALSSKSRGPLESIEGAHRLDVYARDLYGNGKLPTKQQGFLMVTSEWYPSLVENGE